MKYISCKVQGNPVFFTSWTQPQHPCQMLCIIYCDFITLPLICKPRKTDLDNNSSWSKFCCLNLKELNKQTKNWSRIDSCDFDFHIVGPESTTQNSKISSKGRHKVIRSTTDSSEQTEQITYLHFYIVGEIEIPSRIHKIHSHK